MHLKEKNLLKKFAATLKKFSAQGAKNVEYGILKRVVWSVYTDCLLFFVHGFDTLLHCETKLSH